MRCKGVVWRPLVGVLALGACFALGLGIKGAPAGENGRTTVGRTTASVDAVSPGTAGAAAQLSSSSNNTAKPGPRTSSSGQAGVGGNASAAVGPPSAADGVFVDLPSRLAISMGGSVGGAGPLADGGTLPLDAVCTCDSECATDANQCKEVNCSQNIAGDNDWRCRISDKAQGDPCDLDGDLCTDDECNAGTCEAPPLIVMGTVPRSPCSNACSSASAQAGLPCRSDGQCPGGQCEPRTTPAPNAGTTQCTDLGTRFVCEVVNGGQPLGRCCDSALVCSHVTELACTGNWQRLTDPRDLPSCICPTYSAGMAPENVTCVRDPQNSGACEVNTTGSNRVCNLSLRACRNATLDCMDACDAGANLGQFCTTAGDCPGGACVHQTCTADPLLCAAGSESVGDDYSVQGGSYMRLREVRFRGGVDALNDGVLFEIWDSSTPTCSDGSGVGTCATDGAEAECGGTPGAATGTCIGPNRVDAVFTTAFGRAGTDNWRVIVDCADNCDSAAVPGTARFQALSEPVIIPPTGFVTFRALTFVDGTLGSPTNLSAFHVAKAPLITCGDGSGVGSCVNVGDVCNASTCVRAPEVGTNDPDSMWVNGSVVNQLGPGENVLAVELVGDAVPPPAAACCGSTLLVCTDGSGACPNGAVVGDPCNGTCSIAGSPCNADSDCPSGETCISFAGACTFCADTDRWDCRACEGGLFPGQPCIGANGFSARSCGGLAQGGLCSDTPWKGVKNPSTDVKQLCSSGVCNQGGCCDPASGSCTELPSTQCNPANFQGLGTTCDPNCCEQPQNGAPGNNFFTGGDCCTDTAYCDDGSGTDICTSANVGSACGAGGTCQFCVGAIDLGPVAVNAPLNVCSNDSSITCVPAGGGVPECLECTSAFDPTCSGGAIGQACDSGAGTCQLGVNTCTTAPPVRTFTFTGDTNPAGSPLALFTVDMGDDCVANPGDAGWYQKVTIDSGARITVDLCCTAPVLSPVWVILSKGCNIQSPNSPIPNCDGTKRIFFNPTEGGFGNTGFGGVGSNNADVICADGNSSQNYDVQGFSCTGNGDACDPNDATACGGVPADCVSGATYQYAIFEANTCAGSTDICQVNGDCAQGTLCETNNGRYQGHFTIKPLAEAACCGNNGADGPGAVCRVRNKLDCEDEGGDWLGELARGGVFDCTNATVCETGACCNGPGDCDDDGGAGRPVAGATSCASVFGATSVFRGGLLCEDNPCPVCTIDDPANCQRGADQVAWSTDRFNFTRLADDFKPQSGTIHRICWIWTWLDDANPINDFQVVIYHDLNGIPDENGVGPLAPQVFKTMDGSLVVDGFANNGNPAFQVWTYTATFTGDATVTPNDCYWLELTGNTSGGQLGFWMADSALDTTGTHNDASAAGNGYGVTDGDGVYTKRDIWNGDFAFCVDSGMAMQTSPGVDGGCGQIPMACCLPGGGCVDTVSDPTLTASSCRWDPAFNGIVQPFDTCASAVCPVPVADDCATEAIDVNLSIGCPDALGCDDGSGSNPCAGLAVGDSCHAGAGVCFKNLGTCQGNTNRFCRVISPGVDTCPSGSGEGPCIVSPDRAIECNDVPIDNRLATLDGPPRTGPPGPTSCFGTGPFGDGPEAFQADTWYEYTSTCTGKAEIELCEGAEWYDSILEVHEYLDGICDCGNVVGTNRLICVDDGCGDFFGDIINLGGASLLPFDAVDGACYLIRVGGFAPTASTGPSGPEALPGYGIATMKIRQLCQAALAPPPPVMATVYPHGATKTSYISFVPVASPLRAPAAFTYEVTHVASQRKFFISTPRTDGLTAGSVAGLGLTYVVSDDVAGIGALLHDYGAEPIIHVGGCLIAPGESYEIRATSDGVSFSAPLTVPTSPLPSNKEWGDVVGAFAPGGDPSTTPPTPINSWTPPQGVMNGLDIKAVLQAAQNDPNKPDLVWSDVNPSLPDRVANGNDVLRLVNAFRTGSGAEFYPFPLPGVCTAGPGADIRPQSELIP